MKDRQKTDVIFRKWKDDGQIIAIFPHEDWNLEGTECASYMHIGQHSGCEYKFVLMQTVPATREEYKELYDELTGRGYNLQVFMDDDMQKMCEELGYTEQTIMDMVIAFRTMFYVDTHSNRRIKFGNVIKKVGLCNYVTGLNKATYHYTASQHYARFGCPPETVEIMFVEKFGARKVWGFV